jgi:uncharacterized protein YcnI
VRRVLVVFALGAVSLISMAGPAAAHPGIENPYVPTRVATTLALGVPSESPSPMVEVDVTLPSDFALQRVDSVPGWRDQIVTGGIRFFDGNVPQGGYAQFTFAGVFGAKRVVEVPVITKAADGTTVDWDQAPGQTLPAAVVLPGYPVGASPVPGLNVVSGSSGGRNLPIAIGASAVLGGALAYAVLARRRRARAPGAVPVVPVVE